MSRYHCHHCGEAVEIDPPVARTAECESCGRDLRCCMNCRHYDTGYNNHCRETEAEPVIDKDRRNFCEFFEFGSAPPRAAEGKRAADAREKLDALFGGPPASTSRGGDARAKLDALFRRPDSDDED